MNSVLVILSFFLVLLYKSSNSKVVEIPLVDEENPGTPLFLTPLIESGKIDEARWKAAVQRKEMGDVTSYSGYLTVNKEYNSNLFFWFFPALTMSQTAPVILWLQGGWVPGLSSMFGLFAEHGPFSITAEHTLKLRRYSWHMDHNIIYIDNPVGTGFSFTDNEKGYARNFTQVARDLHTALIQFFLLFPELQINDFFVTGESYGGKYVAAVSHAIKDNNIKAETKINLKGLAIGNGFCDPLNQLLFSDYLYQTELIDLNGKAEFQKYEEAIREFVKQKNYIKALENYRKLFDSNNKPSLYYNLTGFHHHSYYLDANKNNDNYLYFFSLFNGWIRKVGARYAIHVGNNTFNVNNNTVFKYQEEDFFESVVVLLIDLLKHYRVLIYSGDVDIGDAYPFAENYLEKMQWFGAEKYAKAPRKLWKVEADLAGYTKSADNLTFVFVRNAENFVSVDQPKWTLNLITRFTRNEEF